ncbi:MAG: isopenicillin N synthase family oxygenase [Alphaproteobacteria bacterium]|jgi:isopenicillin N synthase-like dioxygenase|nr:isopenicillin N synthase family oxygenase [Alphaproteobacteria bacterium]
MPIRDIPVVDIGPHLDGDEAARRAVGQAVDDACQALGFLVITGHRVSPELIDRMARVSRAWFDRPLDEKMRYKMPPDRYRGYTPMESEGLAASLDDVAPPDLKESFSIGPVDVPDDAYHRGAAAGNFFAPNQWPDVPADFRAVWSAYYREMEALATVLMRAFALGLELPETWFDDKVDRHISNFSVIHYPEQATAPLPGQLRAGAHTDYGSLTILYKDSAPGGLQVQNPEGEWIDVPDIDGTFVVNIGDLMAEWTNDRWRSTLHRVVNPPPDAGGMADRLSMPFFHQPNYDAVVECLPSCCGPDNPARYGRTTSGEHVLMKIGKHRLQDAVATAETA